MKLFKVIDVDLDAIRAKVKSIYNRRERKALNGLYDLFEKGDWQGCIDYISTPGNFPYNERGGYSETEHIEPQVWDLLAEMKHDTYVRSEAVIEIVRKDLIQKLSEVSW